MKRFARHPSKAPTERDSAIGRPERLLDIFRRLQSGEITEEDAVKALETRRKRRHGRVGRFVEAITS